MELDERTALRAKRRRQRLLVHYLTLGTILLLLIAAFLAVIIPVVRHKNDPLPTAPVTASVPDAEDTAQTAPPDTGETETSRTDAAETPAPSTDAPAESTEATTESDAPAQIVGPEDSWKLILVNNTHPIPEDYSVTLKELRNGHQVDERMYPELQQMFDDARADGIYPLINESYRTRERQQQILDQYTVDYEAEGLSHEAAVEKALTLVAVPGTSEHELGLALDIVAEYEDDSSATWKWLLDNSWRYGFILRYPEDKVEVTGISYEPWHFRYVGKEAARAITEAGLCLEEYIEQQT